MAERDISNLGVNIFNFEDMICRALKWEKSRGRPPQRVYVSTERQDYVALERFREMHRRYVLYVEKNGRIPRFIRVNPQAETPANESAPDCCDTGFYTLDYQDTGYSCGASSLKMALSALGVEATEQEIMRIAGTTTAGTTHDGMIRAANRFGVSAWFKSFSDTNWDQICAHIKNGGEVVLHVMTHPLANDCKGSGVWRGSYGHYIYLTKICKDRKEVWVADPSKGLRCHTFNQVQAAIAAVTWAPSVLFLQKGTRAPEPVITAKADPGPSNVRGEQGITADIIQDYCRALGLSKGESMLAMRLYKEGTVGSGDPKIVPVLMDRMDITVIGDRIILDPEAVIARLEGG